MRIYMFVFVGVLSLSGIASAKPSFGNRAGRKVGKVLADYLVDKARADKRPQSDRSVQGNRIGDGAIVVTGDNVVVHQDHSVRIDERRFTQTTNIQVQFEAQQREVRRLETRTRALEAMLSEVQRDLRVARRSASRSEEGRTLFASLKVDQRRIDTDLQRTKGELRRAKQDLATTASILGDHIEYGGH